MRPILCTFVAIPSSECPCTIADDSGCDLPKCSPIANANSLCEADGILPDGNSNYDVNNCPGGYEVFKCAPIGDAGPYTKKIGHFCKPNDKMASKNLNDAKKECSKNPSCSMFFESCGKVSYYRCSDSASVIPSVCSATLYRKATDATINITRSGLDQFPAPCGFVTGFVSGESEYLGNAIDEEQCAQMVREEKPLATGASYRKTDRFCWAGSGGSIKDCSICRACVFKLN